MKDRRFLLWIVARLVHVHGDNKDSDFISKLESIAASLPKDRETPNTGWPKGEEP